MSRPPLEKDSLLPTTDQKRIKELKKVEEEDDDDKDEKVNEQDLHHNTHTHNFAPPSQLFSSVSGRYIASFILEDVEIINLLMCDRYCIDVCRVLLCLLPLH
jgi:hypothetical protein